jgi:hypothetical protein
VNNLSSSFHIVVVVSVPIHIGCSKRAFQNLKLKVYGTERQILVGVLSLQLEVHLQLEDQS